MGSARIWAVDNVTDNGDDLAAARRVTDYALEAIQTLRNAFDGQFSRALDAVLAIRGRLVVSGMGKSGHIARKIAATLSSTGTPAHFVHPAEASHGDLGMVTREDALLILSFGGETTELSDLVDYAKRLGIPLISIVGNQASTLAQASDVALVLPAVREACAIGHAPTTSTTLMLVLGDALAVALMERRGFTADQFREFHPGGALGKKLIRVRDIMHARDELPLVKPETPLREAVLLMTNNRHGFAGVVGVVDEKGALVGIITDGDLRRHYTERDLLDRKAAEVMTPRPKTVRPEILASEALTFMNDSAPKITCVFVVEKGGKGDPVGFLHMHDCLKAGIR